MPLAFPSLSTPPSLSLPLPILSLLPRLLFLPHAGIDSQFFDDSEREKLAEVCTVDLDANLVTL